MFKSIAFIGLALSLGWVVLFGCGGSSPTGNPSQRKFTQVNLVSDQAGVAAHTDANLVNGWGISSSPAGPFWISANGTGVSTIYDGTGTTQLAPVTIPAAGGGLQGNSSGRGLANHRGSWERPASLPAHLRRNLRDASDRSLSSHATRRG